MAKAGFQINTVNPQNKNDRTMISRYRRVAVVEEFAEILSQIHNKDCLHAGMKKTFASLSCSPPVHIHRSCCTLDHSVLMIHAAQVQIRGALDAVAKYVDPLSSDVLQTKYSPRQAFIHHPRAAKARK